MITAQGTYLYQFYPTDLFDYPLGLWAVQSLVSDNPGSIRPGLHLVA